MERLPFDHTKDKYLVACGLDSVSGTANLIDRLLSGENDLTEREVRVLSVFLESLVRDISSVDPTVAFISAVAFGDKKRSEIVEGIEKFLAPSGKFNPDLARVVFVMLFEKLQLFSMLEKPDVVN